MRILIIDGEPELAAACHRLFGGEHEVVETRSGFAGLDLLAIGRPFDVILCELALPDMTGMEVHRRLQEASPRSASKLVFVTDDPKQHQAFLAAVPNLQVEKPIVPSALRQVIRDAGMR
jgi:CheY-like chemotaxis protein